MKSENKTLGVEALLMPANISNRIMFQSKGSLSFPTPSHQRECKTRVQTSRRGRTGFPALQVASVEKVILMVEEAELRFPKPAPQQWQSGRYPYRPQRSEMN